MNKYLSDEYEAYSAGTEASEVNRFAIEVMDEIGIDLSPHRSKNLEEVQDNDFDYVVTVCDSARENCPVYLNGQNHMHKSFQDPAAFEGDENEKREYFRSIRDQIKSWIQESF